MRNLQKDLEICEKYEKATLPMDKRQFTIDFSNSDMEYLTQAREGWPEAIMRAAGAELMVKEIAESNQLLRDENARLRARVAELEG